MKEYTIVKNHRDKEREVTGTLEYLIDYFSYTLKAGNSYNPKINTNPTTAISLVSNLNKSIAEIQRGSYSPDDYELKA